MIRCDDCGDIFDSDADPDCFIEGSSRVLCEPCRNDYPEGFFSAVARQNELNRLIEDEERRFTEDDAT